MNGQDFWTEIAERMDNSDGKWMILFGDDGPALLGEGIKDQDMLNQFLMGFYSTPESGIEIQEEVVEVM